MLEKVPCTLIIKRQIRKRFDKKKLYWNDWATEFELSAEFHGQLRKKLREMVDDPSVKLSDWHEMLKIAKHSDTWYRKNNSYATKYAMNEDFVREEMT